MKKNEKLVFTINGRSIKATHGDTILEACLKNHFDIDHSCGGMGSCGTCRVIVIEGVNQLEVPNEIESELSNDRQFEPNERLACQNQCVAGLVLSTIKVKSKKG